MTATYRDLPGYPGCWIDAEGKRIASTVGHVLPADLGLPWVSNNVTEVLGILAGLEALEDGWCGVVYSDSLCAINTVRNCLKKSKPPKWLPAPILARAKTVVARLGEVMYVLLGGHPNRKELAAGFRSDGKPCSEHNVHCDKLCKREGEELAAALATLEEAAK
jgi:hypothetical protein